MYFQFIFVYSIFLKKNKCLLMEMNVLFLLLLLLSTGPSTIAIQHIPKIGI